MKLKTWHLEAAVMAAILMAVVLAAGSPPAEWLGAAAVFVATRKMSIADRMAESQAARAAPDVECWRWSTRYHVAGELLFGAYFIWIGAWSALAGVALMLAYPAWRRLYRRLRPRGEEREQVAPDPRMLGGDAEMEPGTVIPQLCIGIPKDYMSDAAIRSRARGKADRLIDRGELEIGAEARAWIDGYRDACARVLESNRGLERAAARAAREGGALLEVPPGFMSEATVRGLADDSAQRAMLESDAAVPPRCLAARRAGFKAACADLPRARADAGAGAGAGPARMGLAARCSGCGSRVEALPGGRGA